MYVINKVITFLKVTTYQNVVMIQLFEPIRCKMINKTYENVQEVIRDFRLVFSTFRHTSQVRKTNVLIFHIIFICIFVPIRNLMTLNVNL